MEHYLWAIPLLPLMGAMLNGFGALTGKLSRGAVHLIACSTVFLSFILALATFVELMGMGHTEHGVQPQLIQVAYSWISAGSFHVDAAVLVDALSGAMILVVTGVGFLIHLYSVGYMAHEECYARYFAYLNLFTFSMLILVMGESMPMMFVGWEGVGVCSYLLIGFWFTEGANADAGKKAFIVNRIGDFGFLLGMFLLYWTLEGMGLKASLSFPALKALIVANPIPTATATAICLLLFVGATGKSAQIPLFVWLPDAMAGPTPVSALIHAATMVTAGVYMICRLNFLYMLSPTAMTVVATIGALTAFFAATIGVTQNDIKKVLAYSTVSQLGYMFMAVGLGAFSAAMFHLITHAFFKACLFLGSGSVIHGMGGEQDMRKMGGLRKYMPATFWTFLIATVAIAGVVGMSGFASKDEILARALMADPAQTLLPGGGVGLYVLGFGGALLTTFYMFRLVFMTFFGEFRGDEDTRKHLHESPWTMTVPLWVLAGLSIVGGAINWPSILGGTERLHHWLGSVIVSEPIWQEVNHTTEFGLMATLQLLIAAAVAYAYHRYLKQGRLPSLAEIPGEGLVYRLSFHKYFVDEIYYGLIVNPTYRFSRRFLWHVFDVKIIDGIVNGVGRAVKAASYIVGIFHSGQVNTYALSVVLGMLAILGFFAMS